MAAMAGHRVPRHAPDARGHATTRWDVRDGFRYAWLVDDALEVADALGFETFHLLGFSMGAATALGVAARAPERLRTLVLVGLSPDREPRASVARRLFDPARILAHDPAWAEELSRRHDPVQGPGAWQRLLPAIAADVAAQQLHGPAELVRIDAPALVAVGDRDPFVPVDQAWRLRRQLPHARLLVAPDCGHELMRRHPTMCKGPCAGFYTETASIAAARAAGRPAPASDGARSSRPSTIRPRPTRSRTPRPTEAPA